MEKPAQPHEVTQSIGNGQQIPDGLATIGEKSRQVAMARALLENEWSTREQVCAADIQEAIAKISERHGCVIQFIETRINGNSVEIGFRSVAVERLKK